MSQSDQADIMDDVGKHAHEYMRNVSASWHFNYLPGGRGKSKFEKVKVWKFSAFSRIEHVCKSK